MEKPLKVLFLVHNIATWDCLHGLYRHMRSDADFTPIVGSIPRNFPGVTGFHFEADTCTALQKLGLEPVRLNSADSFADLERVKAIRPDIIFRQAHWENDVPPALSTANLSFAKLCYVPYGIMGMVGDAANRNHCSAYHAACWKLFLPNAAECDEVVAYRPRGGEGCHVVGHPSIEALKNAEPVWPIRQVDGKRRFRMIWAPHHTIWGDWLRYGTFLQIFEAMLAWAKTADDIECVLRPHPMLMTMLEPVKKGDAKKQIEQFFEDWKALPNTAISHEEVYASLFAASDLLFSDGIGFLLEYQLCKKPIIFLERCDREPFVENSKIIETGLHRVHTLREAMKKILLFKEGAPDPLRPMQDTVCETLLDSVGCSQKIAAHIVHDFTT